jgi:hypothetical protein
MKNAIAVCLVLLSSVLVLTSCSNSKKEAPSISPELGTNYEKNTQSSFNEVPKLLGSTPNGPKIYRGVNTDIVFIDRDIGWKALYSAADTHQQNITLFKSTDGGLNWNKITSTSDKNYTIPLTTKVGITFLDNNYGWITTMSPQEGYIGLFRTLDGGRNWEKQEIIIPSNYVTSQFQTFPPTWFTANDGILLNVAYSNIEGLEPLVFITIDKGRSWVQLNMDSEKLDFKWNNRTSKDGSSEWIVIFKNQTWQSRDGLTWVMHNNT